MTGTPRERAREQTLADITRIGRVHLARDGAAALSLRAVARDLGVVSSAVYRYVKSRDELLTLLVVEGYTELGDAVDVAVASAPAGDPRARLHALGHAVRDWALAEPACYGLLFGSPVPGYQAPAERTTGPGTRVIGALVKIFDEAGRSGELAVPQTIPMGAPLRENLRAIRTEMGLELPEEALARGVLAWSSLFGAVNFEVFGQYGADTFTDPRALFEHHLSVLDEMVGLAPQV
ncbi:TetR/AcrR family transcriptional regulator [Rhodococcus maanshanensis]|uniref:DNA-binding transcriptional regulator, AcrR family n=1 Tax=Rhodococcus maanshanensis TaxID=183556 RepID=A0A1H7WQG1_9NOCA|nr:TetR/AcrR family transcriptional regulator [Rhodococcus maanshanensis]SEM23681.1 DNA-binding transcriptional regulator, AcrR family [Rhodococcus maanshanensis]